MELERNLADIAPPGTDGNACQEQQQGITQLSDLLLQCREDHAAAKEEIGHSQRKIEDTQIVVAEHAQTISDLSNQLAESKTREAGQEEKINEISNRITSMTSIDDGLRHQINNLKTGIRKYQNIAIDAQEKTIRQKEEHTRLFQELETRTVDLARKSKCLMAIDVTPTVEGYPGCLIHMNIERDDGVVTKNAGKLYNQAERIEDQRRLAKCLEYWKSRCDSPGVIFSGAGRGYEAWDKLPLQEKLPPE